MSTSSCCSFDVSHMTSYSKKMCQTVNICVTLFQSEMLASVRTLQYRRVLTVCMLQTGVTEGSSLYVCYRLVLLKGPHCMCVTD